MHFLMMISDTPSMVFQTELLIRSIKNFSHFPVAFSVVIQGHDEGPIKNPLPLININHHNKYLSDNAEMLYCPYFWELGAPCRWFIDPQMDTCVLIDVDMIACSDLSPLFELDKDSIHGVTAFKNKVSNEQWESINLLPDDRQYYFNMGMLIVPSKHLTHIGNKLFDVYPEMSKINQYYSGQISFTYIVKEMGLKRNTLPPEFNWYDKQPYPNSEIIFLHYFSNRHHVTKKIIDSSTHPNKYTELINNTSKKIFLLKLA